MKKLLLLPVLFMLSIFAFTQTNKPLEHSRELLRVMGSLKSSEQMMDMMITSFKQNMPNVPIAFWDEFKKEVNLEELIEQMAPVYVKYYTDDELVQLIAFYKTPLGQKVTEKLPLINQDSFAIGQEWGKKIGEKAAARLKEKGYLKND